MNPVESSPKGSRRKILVVCGVFHRPTDTGIEIALFERKEPSVEFEFPGGKVDPGESENQALVRELHEELSVRVTVGDKLGETVFDYPTVTIDLRAYWVETSSFDFRLVDHFRWTWVNAQNWQSLKTVAADIPLLRSIFSQ